MGLLRKKTAAEKKRKQDQKEAKKELKDEKKDIKKDARKEKKDIRKDARDDKKEIRKSDATGKEKREAKKDIRQDKRNDVKDINKDKKEEVKDVKKEIKEVKRWLNIELPSVAGNVAILRADLHDISYAEKQTENGNEILVEKELVIEDAFDILENAYAIAKEISARGLRRLQTIIDEPRDQWTSIWADRVRLNRWFGAVDKASDVKDVYDRLKSVDDRLNKKITIRFHPQRDQNTNAQNMGTFFEPKTFKVFPKLIENSLDEETKEIGYNYIASVLIHELIHVWFTDQKLDGETVYGDELALKLAEDNPKKARRSAENYEHFCMSFA